MSPLPNIPRYQLHLPPKTRFGDPQKPSPRKARKISGNSGFPIKDYGIAKKRPIQGIPRNSFWDPERAFWDDFPGWMIGTV